MSTVYESTIRSLQRSPRVWLVTGAAGFIGSNLTETLLLEGQTVVGLDNFATGSQVNLDDVRLTVGPEGWQRFRFIEGDITDLSACQQAVQGVDYVLHQAALGSVPRSIGDPINSNRTNVDGFLNMLVSCKDAGVQRFVYAGSSSTYGDHPALPKVESQIGNPLSPYAVTKYVNELYGNVFAQVYDYNSIGLRYFNVFGKRQNPNGPYAAVIPKWVSNLLERKQCTINGDGSTSRDFCYIKNVVQANILAATTDNPSALNEIYNVAYGAQTTLLQLYELIKINLSENVTGVQELELNYLPFRKGDVRHSLADTSKARRLLGYEPTHSVEEGLKEALDWYVKQSILR